MKYIQFIFVTSTHIHLPYKYCIHITKYFNSRGSSGTHRLDHAITQPLLVSELCKPLEQDANRCTINVYMDMIISKHSLNARQALFSQMGGLVRDMMKSGIITDRLLPGTKCFANRTLLYNIIYMLIKVVLNQSC